ncbi:hypothetical protein CHBEV_303 [Choristoneura biennis entomopoxvirus]|uniref:Uncharacterized protein n=1 Tax=Choristoneura biennis entomopoxvirus TaxID=10288 RepID=A0A916KPY5_CBEPV|nr:hypothetical protein CHBEV_303 [Choristoneura biennis entomopoxvirus]CCU55871.1 hypothetical protein CHBEV_303 [Choristoneura biennis entomopoxvirus]
MESEHKNNKVEIEKKINYESEEDTDVCESDEEIKINSCSSDSDETNESDNDETDEEENIIKSFPVLDDDKHIKMLEFLKLAFTNKNSDINN